MNYTNNNKLQRNITSIINERLLKTDKNDDDYLILKLENGEDVFVFSSNVDDEWWRKLNNGGKYNFTVKEGKQGANLLIDFELIEYE